eukprot:15366861-Ditylum_brightwellii.AAC.1
MCVPTVDTTNDGVHTWQSKGCSGIAGDVIVCQDGIFQNHLDLFDKWENTLLKDVHVMELIHMIMDYIQQSSFLVATDGSSGMESMLFAQKITTKTGNPLALYAGLAFGQSSSL